MTRTTLATAGLIALMSASALTPLPAQAANRKAWDHGSTALALGLGALAAGSTLAKSDAPGAWQLAYTIGSTFLATEALKAAIKEQRPDGSGNDSFPSGHTSMAFAAATYFNIRYGHEYPQYVPWVYGAAALTGIARVEAKKHYAQDVVAGAALGWVLARYFTTAQDAQVTVAPTADGAAVTFTQHF